MGKYLYIIFFMLCFALPSAAIGPAILSGIGQSSSSGPTNYTDDPNCQGAWLFDDDLTDESGEGNTLTDGGTVSYTTDRPSGFTTGKSIDGDGSTDFLYIDTGDQSANFLGKAYTADAAFCAWIYHDNSGGQDKIFDVSREKFRGAVTSVDEFNVEVTDADSSANSDIATSHTSAAWEHVCFSYDGSDAELTVWVSLDTGSFGDRADGVTTAFTGVDGIKDADLRFSIGASADATPANFFDGHIYQPIIFDRELLDDGSEAEEMYNYGIKGAD